MREQKRAAVLKEKRAGSGSTSPPRVVVSIVFSMILCTSIVFCRYAYGSSSLAFIVSNCVRM